MEGCKSMSMEGCKSITPSEELPSCEPSDGLSGCYSLSYRDLYPISLQSPVNSVMSMLVQVDCIWQTSCQLHA